MTTPLVRLAVSLLSLMAFASPARQAPPASPPAQLTPPKPEDWTSTLAVPPGSSLPKEFPLLAQVVTLFTLTDARIASGQYFVAGTGYVEIDGGGTFFSGANRKQDPYLEVTIMPVGVDALTECRRILVQKSFSEHAVRITGAGLFTSREGVGKRQLGIVRLDTLSGCQLVPRY